MSFSRLLTGSRYLPGVYVGAVPVVDGSPVFLGLAYKDGLHPCKICVESQGRPVPLVSYGGQEHAHEGAT
ncbi:hypothetical protein V8D89_008349 [Ganoderma adspersum]